VCVCVCVRERERERERERQREGGNVKRPRSQRLYALMKSNQILLLHLDLKLRLKRKQIGLPHECKEAHYHCLCCSSMSSPYVGSALR